MIYTINKTIDTAAAVSVVGAACASVPVYYMLLNTPIHGIAALFDAHSIIFDEYSTKKKNDFFKNIRKATPLVGHALDTFWENLPSKLY